MADTPVVYADDPNAAWTFEVTDNDGSNLEFTPMVAIGAGPYDTEATWLGDPGPARDLRVSFAGLTGGGLRTVYLQVPGGNDVRLGSVYVKERD